MFANSLINTRLYSFNHLFRDLHTRSCIMAENLHVDARPLGGGHIGAAQGVGRPRGDNGQQWSPYHILPCTIYNTMHNLRYSTAC